MDQSNRYAGAEERASEIPFETDDRLAARLRLVVAELSGRGLSALAAEVAVVAELLDPEPAA
jgi:hypothetical protein